MKAAALAALWASVWPALAAADDDPKQIDGDRPFQCLRDGDGRVWRVQCAPEGTPSADKICVYAPDSELDSDGSWSQPLERAKACWPSGTFEMDALAAQGYRLVPGLADAPYGWVRDARQRVMQVNFDLKRRLYVGGSWAPAEGEMGRAGVDFGLLIFEHFSPGSKLRLRHRLKLVEGEVLIAPFSARVKLFHYDLSVWRKKPLFRLTTFFGEPRRYDGRLNLGFWVEAADLEVHENGLGQEENLWRYATAAFTADLWQSRDLTSYVRARAGLGLERTYTDMAEDRQALTPHAALELDLSLDRDGFHHVVGEAVWEGPLYYEAPAAAGDHAQRMRADLGYEVIVVALNDQPFTLRLAAGTSWRDDLPRPVEEEPTWDLHATAGLRFSLWAPARQKY
jgi:hypothetical protein